MTERLETVVLDCEGLSCRIRQDRKVAAMFEIFHRDGAQLVISANTIVEATPRRANQPRMNWALSRLRVEPVTERAAKEAARLLDDAGLHGHTYALDATVAEVALRSPGPVAVLTSDVDDLSRLCGDRVRLIAV